MRCLDIYWSSLETQQNRMIRSRRWLSCKATNVDQKDGNGKRCTLRHDDTMITLWELDVCKSVQKQTGTPMKPLYFVGKKASKIPSLPVEFPFSISEIDCVF